MDKIVEDRFDLDSTGQSDDIVARAQMFRLERMSDKAAWLCVYRDGDDGKQESVVINISVNDDGTLYISEPEVD